MVYQKMEEFYQPDGAVGKRFPHEEPPRWAKHRKHTQGAWRVALREPAKPGQVVEVQRNDGKVTLRRLVRWLGSSPWRNFWETEDAADVSASELAVEVVVSEDEKQDPAAVAAALEAAKTKRCPFKI